MKSYEEILYGLIKSKVSNKLTDEQIKCIVKGLDFKDGQVPQIILTFNPFEFDLQSMTSFLNLPHKGIYTNLNTNVLIGDCKPGWRDCDEYEDDDGNAELDIGHSNFSIRKIQVVVKTGPLTYYDKAQPTIYIYLPDKYKYSTYPTQMSFKTLFEKCKTGTDLKLKNALLHALENERDAISKAENRSYSDLPFIK